MIWVEEREAEAGYAHEAPHEDQDHVHHKRVQIK